MNRLLNGLHNGTNFTRTENGAIARETTNSALLDYFSHGGALRSSIERAVPLFANAYSEDKLAALKLMFYFRDVRGGQGQREAFRKQLQYLATNQPNTIFKNIKLIAEYGRWDDLYALIGTPLEKTVYAVFRDQLKEDIENYRAGKSVSLLAKWLKSENTSSAKSKKLAKRTRKALNLTSKQYRKTLSALRKYIDVLEVKMSSNRWTDINYNEVPSNAMLKHLKAFYRHDSNGMANHMAKVVKGEAKVNVKTVYPYEIIDEFLNNHYYSSPSQDIITAKSVLWDNLPDYVKNADENSIAVVDTSGSMWGIPITVSVSIGLYLAERAGGPFKDHFITFSRSPKLQKVVGNNIYEKVRNLSQADWDYNTDVEAVFNLILDVARRNRLSQDEMLSKVYIISDMEFDSCSSVSSSRKETLFSAIRRKYEHYGYNMPQLVFWNVDARNKQFPMSLDDSGFLNVSGFSPSIFEKLLKGDFVTPEGLMWDVIDSDRYKAITI